MQIGLCTNNYTDSFETLKAVKETGADFIEVRGYTIQGYELQKVKELKQQLIDLNLPALASNCVLPGSVGFFADEKVLNDYIDSLFERLAILGVNTQVVGSGRLRNIPEGVDPNEHAKRFAEVLHRSFIPRCEQYGITLCIESLNKKETNFIHTVKEGVEFAKMVNSPYVAAHIDSYHMGMEDEAFETLKDYKGIVKHVHIAAPNSSRAYPYANDGIDWKHIINNIKYSGCDKIFSLEATTRTDDPWAEIKESINLLRPIV